MLPAAREPSRRSPLPPFPLEASGAAAGAHGLDYDCGPGPALAAMLREAGHSVAVYDPFFYPDPEPLTQVYDFEACTETVEHFHRPADEFARLMALVRPGGWLAIMTRFQTGDLRFRDWHYRKDPTHVVFYREETLRHLAAAGWRCPPIPPSLLCAHIRNVGLSDRQSLRRQSSQHARLYE